jgi:hypothetical protein
MGSKIVKIAPVELVGINEEINASDWTKSIALALPSDYDDHGEITHINMTMTSATGTLKTQGSLVFFSADPAISAGDTAITAGEWETVLGVVPIVTADWLADVTSTVGGVVSKDTSIVFEGLSTVYAAFLVLAAETAINSLAGDDELVKLSVVIARP